MASKVCEIVKKVVEPVAEKFGYEVVGIDFSKKVDGMNLEITIDKDGKPITIEDCEKLHREIDSLLDEANPTDDKPYILSVCSPGIDRPIKTHRDFLRNEGKEVEVKLFSKQNGEKVFQGVLIDFSDSIVTISHNKEELTFDRNIVANISPVIKF